ncbi:unnamed protein product, partial [Rotaria sp. Silwood1]
TQWSIVELIDKKSDGSSTHPNGCG